MRQPIRRYPFKQQPLKIIIETPARSFGDKVMGAVKRVLIGFGTIFAFFLVLYIYAVVSLLSETKPDLPDRIVLAHHFYGEISETDTSNPLSFSPPQPSLPELLDVLHKGAKDPNVIGFVARISNLSYNLSQLYDLRAALEEFRAAGKFAYAYSDSFGEDGSGMGEYFLAAGFEQIWMQPIGILGINGFNADSIFFKGLFDKYMVQPEFFHREEYKSAMDMFTRTDMSPESKSNLEALIKDMSHYYTKEVARSRGEFAKHIEKMINESPLTAEAALETGMIDKIAYSDEFLKFVNEKFNVSEKDKNYVALAKYASADSGLEEESDLSIKDVLGKSKKTKIANIVMEGPIMSGSSSEGGASPFSQNKVILSRDFAKAITKAAEEEDIKGLFVRIDSPGGSPTASETIRRALEYAQMKGKPVVVSMGSVAASGGYWIASIADKIYATPATLTGSIGVVSGKFVVDETLKNYGITHDGVQYGENAEFLSPFEGFDAQGQKKMNETLDYIYDGFLERVAKGRGKDKEEIRKIAKGQVWSGMAAKENGLIDELGGLDIAKAGLAELLEVSSVSDLEFIDYPRHKSPVEKFLMMLGGETVLVPKPIQSFLSEIYTRYQMQNNAAIQIFDDRKISY